jgi:phage baseplate assembly protein W
MIAIPHLQIPLRLLGNHLGQVEQDTVDDVAQCVQVIVSTPLGFSDELPDMGLTMQEFYVGGADVEEIQAQLDEHEPRWAGLVEEAPDKLDVALSVVSVRVSQ